MFLPVSIPSPDYSWNSFNIGQWLRDLGLDWFSWDLTIHMYALCILTGIIAAGLLTGYRLRQRRADAGLVFDIGIWAVIFGIAGGRFFHVITHPNDYFGPGKDLMKTLYLWEGGMAIYGALIFGAVGVYLGCRIAGVRFWSFADALAPGLLLAQAFGRLGNWFNHELYGLPTDLPWGLEIESSNAAFPAGLPEGTLFHPTFLYEIVWNLIGVVVIIYLGRHWTWSREGGFLRPVAGEHRLQWGRLLGVYLIWYGIGRSVLESIRVDPSEVFFGIRTNVWMSFFAIALGLVIVVVQGRRHRGLEPSPYLPGREEEAESAVHSENLYTDDDFVSDEAAKASHSENVG